jgi:hypothetical protein
VNKDNYATLEAAQRLVDAGIVLETEKCWSMAQRIDITEKWHLEVNSDSIQLLPKFPAPSMAEVWRELHIAFRQRTDGLPYLRLIAEKDATIVEVAFASKQFRNINPTDALIDLLIWVTAQEGV